MHAGELIGERYKLAGQPLGHGAFGVVWRAEELFTLRDNTTNTTETKLISDVAVKIFTAELDFHELQILATCDHPNILRYRSIVEHRSDAGRDHVCLVTELAESGDVAAMLRGAFRKGLPPIQVERIVLSIAEALVYLCNREAPIVHRDIKPQNMLVVGSTIKLGDVGTAKALEGGGTDTSTNQGTIAYAAPERFDGKILPAVDIYSLGVSAFELLTGRLPFEGTPLQLMKLHTEARPNIPQNLPSHWKELLNNCLVKDPANRWDAKQLVWFLRDRQAEEERKRLETTASEAVSLRSEKTILISELEDHKSRSESGRKALEAARSEIKKISGKLAETLAQLETSKQEIKSRDFELKKLSKEIEQTKTKAEKMLHDIEELRRVNQELQSGSEQQVEGVNSEILLLHQQAESQQKFLREKALVIEAELIKERAVREEISTDLEKTRKDLEHKTLELDQIRKGNVAPESRVVSWRRRLSWTTVAGVFTAATAALALGWVGYSMLTVEEVLPPIPEPAIVVNPEEAENEADLLETSNEIQPQEQPDNEPPPLNRWIKIEPPITSDFPIVLGLPEKSGDFPGFWPESKIIAPSERYEIQQHEVSWKEATPWFESHDSLKVDRPDWATEDHPITNIPWEIAQAYCAYIGGFIPTEEEWEFAARGTDLRPYSWGDNPPDISKTHMFRSGQPLSKVMTNPQDRTPGSQDISIYDLMGNALEWTDGFFRNANTGRLENWARDRFRPVRGLIPHQQPPTALPPVGAAYRSSICVAGRCTANAREEREYRVMLENIGFRCVR